MSTAAKIIAPVQFVLNDAGVRWTETELLEWISQGEKVIALLRPDATAATKNLTLIAGTRQTISDMKLLDIYRNMGADGNTPGRPVKLVQREMLDGIRGWHTETPASYISNFAYDERMPQEFWCYPPAQSGIKVEASVSVSPPAVDATTDTLTILPIFDAPLMDYVLYRAFQKGSTVGNLNRAGAHFQTFALALGQEAMAKIAASPNKFNFGGVPPSQ